MSQGLRTQEALLPGVLGMLGQKETMRTVLCAHGLGEVDRLAKEWEEKPGIYAFLSPGRGGESGGEAVVLVFFWHPGEKLPLHEARGSVSTSFVRYVMEMADEVLVCLEQGDVAAVRSAVEQRRGRRQREGPRETRPAAAACHGGPAGDHRGLRQSAPRVPSRYPEGSPKWCHATLSLPALGASGVLVKTEATGEADDEDQA